MITGGTLSLLAKTATHRAPRVEDDTLVFDTRMIRRLTVPVDIARAYNLDKAASLRTRRVP
jgi:hypothetical protein